MKLINRIFTFMVIAMCIFALTGCAGNSAVAKDDGSSSETVASKKIENNPIVTMVVEYADESGTSQTGTIKLELYPNEAPETVTNFVNLASRGYYNGLTFHRIVQNFMIQGGDPQGDGAGGPSLSDINNNVTKGSSSDYRYSIKGEFSANQYDNQIKFEAGVIAMGRSDFSALGMAETGYNSAGSQFFIVNTDSAAVNANLQGNYAPFGKVIEGYEVVANISKTKVVSNGRENSKPEVAPVIKELTIDTKGEQYNLPSVINFDAAKAKVQERYNELVRQYYSNQS